MRQAAFEREREDEQYAYLATHTPRRQVLVGGALAGVAVVTSMVGIWAIVLLGANLWGLLFELPYRQPGDPLSPFFSFAEMGWGSLIFVLALTALLSMVGMGAAGQKSMAKSVKLSGEDGIKIGYELLVFFFGALLTFFLMTSLVVLTGPYSFVEIAIDLILAGFIVSGVFTAVFFPFWSSWYRRILVRISPADYDAYVAEIQDKGRKQNYDRGETASAMRRFTHQAREDREEKRKKWES